MLRGYVGDRNANTAWVTDHLRLVDQSKFDVLGKQGARPFEVATVRLQNMAAILPQWETLAPPDKVGSSSSSSSSIKQGRPEWRAVAIQY